MSARSFPVAGSTWARAWAKDSAVLLASQLSAVAVGWLLVVVLARSLGPSQFGLFSALYALSQGLAMVVDFGLVTFLLRDFAALDLSRRSSEQQLAPARTLLGGALGLTTLLSIAVLTLALAASASLGASLELIAGLIGLMGYTFALAGAAILESGFRARRDFGPVVALTLGEKVVLLAALGSAVSLGAGVPLLAGCYLGVGLGRLAVAAVCLRRRTGLGVARPAVGSVVAVARAAAPFAVNRASLTLITRIDVALIALFSTVDAAYYAVGDRTNTMLVIGAATLTSTLYPFLEGSTTQRMRRSLHVSGVMACLGLALAVPGVLLAENLLAILVGADYEGGAATLRIMLLAAPFMFGANALLSGLYSAGREGDVAWLTGVVSVLGTTAVVLGEAAHGTEGAAIGFLARQVAFALCLAVAAVATARRERAHA